MNQLPGEYKSVDCYLVNVCSIVGPVVALSHTHLTGGFSGSAAEYLHRPGLRTMGGMFIP